MTRSLLPPENYRWKQPATCAFCRVLEVKQFSAKCLRPGGPAFVLATLDHFTHGCDRFIRLTEGGEIGVEDDDGKD